MKRFLALLSLAVLMIGPARAEEMIVLQPRAGVGLTVYLTMAPGATRSVILFTGGNGVVAGGRTNFLLRTAPQYVADGINVAIPEVPADQGGGLTDLFRASAENATDIAAVIALLKQRSPAPVWLVGTSRGTISAAAVAARIGPPSVSGLVLTSTVWRALNAVTRLDAIRVPTLVVHNKDDGCFESPFAETAAGMAAIRAAPVKAQITVAGGSLVSAPCQARSPHGYFGIESQVVPGITAWIKGH
jgi:predicted alpha/beta-fold hydrolase